MKNIKLGSHVSMSAPNFMLGSVKEALSYNANALMIYTGAPQNTKRSEIEKLKVKEAIELMKENGIDPHDVIIHAPYIVNLANPDAEKRQFAVDFLKQEYIRTSQMGAKYMVIHPGSCLGFGTEQGALLIAQGINKIIDPKIGTVILLETMAGKGNEVGYKFEQLKLIIDNVDEKDHIGVCMDTCHIHDAGYDLTNFDNVLDEFDKVIGLDKLKCIHVNGSKNEKGARKDRHANLGDGFISKEDLKWIVNNPRTIDMVKILETPYIDDKPPYKEEIEYLLSK